MPGTAGPTDQSAERTRPRPAPPAARPRPPSLPPGLSRDTRGGGAWRPTANEKSQRVLPQPMGGRTAPPLRQGGRAAGTGSGWAVSSRDLAVTVPPPRLRPAGRRSLPSLGPRQCPGQQPLSIGRGRWRGVAASVIVYGCHLNGQEILRPARSIAPLSFGQELLLLSACMCLPRGWMASAPRLLPAFPDPWLYFCLSHPQPALRNSPASVVRGNLRLSHSPGFTFQDPAGCITE